MRYQRQSEVPKKGNPEDHEQAVKNVIHFLEVNAKGNWFYWKEWYERRSGYQHSYDLAVLELYTDPKVLERQPFLFIEVDGEKHETELTKKMKLPNPKPQTKNDQVAETYVKEVLKKDIIRLDKVECNGKLADRMDYFRDKLRKYIK